MEKRELILNYEGISEDHIYLHRQNNFNLLIRLIGGGEKNTIYTNEFDIFVINPTNTEIVVTCYQFDSEKIYSKNKNQSKELMIAILNQIKFITLKPINIS
ncbi:hypothetical protein [Xenorhabdus beddingii]|uniref:hypothetical protein n=1 Tax=Xenorhabdus beddingii TaxID=40578 RepID=UPI000A321616|nr:hypothetical protein [Xenorhabdus beddingii]